MTLKKTILASVVGTMALGGILYAIVSPTKASKDNAIAITTTFKDSLKSTLHKRSFPNTNAKGKEDSIIESGYTQIVKALSQPGIYDTTVVIPPVITPPNTGTNPGGPEFTGPYSYSKQSNINISGKTFTGKTLSFDGCSNITINLCTFNGGKGTNLYAINLNNCTNVNITNSFGTMYCDFVHAKGGSNIKVNGNQVLNLYEPTIYANDFAHAIRFESVTGAGNEIKANIIENVPGVCVNPHDIINLVNCVGTASSHIIVSGNKIRGGMVTDGFGKGTGAGITLDNGTYIDVTKNIGVNPGAAFIQANTYNGGTHNSVLIDGNIAVSLIKSSVSHDAYIGLGSKTNVTISNNKANWIKFNGATGGSYPGGEVLLWMGSNSTTPGIKLINNTFDKTLTNSILPDKIITYHL